MSPQELLIHRAQNDTNLRWWIIAAVLGTVAVLYQNQNVLEFWPVLTVIGAGTLYNFILSLLAYNQRVARSQHYLEIIVDIVLISALIHFTGGILHSPLFFLYPLMIIMLAFHHHLSELSLALAGLLVAIPVLGLQESLPPGELDHLWDRLLVLASIATAALVYTTVFLRELTTTRSHLQEREGQLEEAKLISDKLQEKIYSSTKKLEEANVMLVKKNLAMMALHEIYMAMTSTYKSSRLFNLVMDTAMSLMKASTGCLLLQDAADKKLRPRVARGMDHKRVQQLAIKPGEGLEGLVFKTGKEHKADDLTRFEEYCPLNADSKSKLCSPLRIKNKTVGVVTVESTRSEAFTKSDMDLLATLASQASEVLQNVELYEEMRTKANGLSLLFEITKEISTIFDLERLFDTIILRAMQAMKARGGSLMIYDEERDQLVVRAAVGLANDAPREVRVDSGIAGWVYRHARPINIPVVAEHHLFDRQNDAFYSGRTLIASPLSVRSKVFGVICLVDRVGKIFDLDDLQLLNALASQAAVAIEHVDLNASIRRDYIQAIKALAASVDAKDHYTHGHSNKVMAYAAMIAKELKLGDKEIEKIKYGALLHDVGKIGISEAVLNKPTKLTPKEFDTIAMHPILGVSIVQNIESLKELIPIILYHHERFSGGGYPEGISGNNIPLGARIVGAADAWDVMTSDRAYRKALPLDVAIAEMKKCAGTQFDPDVVTALLQALGKHEKAEIFRAEEDHTKISWDEDEISRLMS